MSVNYLELSKEYYKENEQKLIELTSQIWNEHDATMAQSAINRSFTEEEWSYYYLIQKDEKTIWITGYYEIDSKLDIVGLNHHGILPEYRWKWLGKKTLQDLIQIIKTRRNNKLDWIIELVPSGNNNIENIFVALGFQDYTEKAIETLEFIRDILAKGYYAKAYLLK